MTTDEQGRAGETRRVLVLSHTGREAARDVTSRLCKALTEHGIVVRLLAEEAADLGIESSTFDPAIELHLDDTDLACDCELAVVVGGDGSILRAAEVTWGSGTPVLGVNLGHVGFLAEAEVEEVEPTIRAIVDASYAVEDRLTLDVEVIRGGEVVDRTFAVNEASVEKAARERMLEVIARTDGIGVLWCDGRRAVDLPPGARIEVRRAEQPVRLARLHQAPFTDRLVAKFDLPVQGWRGRRRSEGDVG